MQKVCTISSIKYYILENLDSPVNTIKPRYTTPRFTAPQLTSATYVDILKGRQHKGEGVVKADALGRGC